jgi:hypothetical protein
MFNREKKIIEAAFQKLDVSLFSRNPFWDNSTLWFSNINQNWNNQED